MKINDLINETTEQETALSAVANAAASYITHEVIPQLKETASQGTAVSSMNDPELEYYILSGYTMKNGYINGKELPENLEKDFYIYLGKLTNMISNYRGIDKKVINVIQKLKLYFLITDEESEALYTKGENEISLMINKIFSSKNAVNEKKLASLLAHEMRHALDDLLSKGKIFKGDDTKLKSVENDDEDIKHQTYLRLQSEGNARFSQAARDLIDLVQNNKEMDINKFKTHLKELTELYGLMTTEKKKQYKNFMKRALKLYHHLMAGRQQ